MCLIIKLIDADKFLIIKKTEISTSSSLSEAKRYGLFSDLVEVKEVVEKFDSNMKLGKDYSIISIKINEELQVILDIKLLVKMLPILLQVMNGDLSHEEFNIEIRKIKKNWSWYNCFKWVASSKLKKAFEVITDDELKQANITRIEALALITAISDWDNANA